MTTTLTGDDEPDRLASDAAADLAALSQHERTLVYLRTSGLSFREIAAQLGDPLTAETVQRQYRRALLHLRGRVHVRLWQQHLPGRWPVPPCQHLAALMAQVQRRLAAGQLITVTVYRGIGAHLDPRPGDGRRICRICRCEVRSAS